MVIFGILILRFIFGNFRKTYNYIRKSYYYHHHYYYYYYYYYYYFLYLLYFVNLKITDLPQTYAVHNSFASSNGLPKFLIRWRFLFSAGFKFTGNDVKEKPILTYHRMIEAFNFDAAKRTYLQDPDYSSKVMQVRLKNLTTFTAIMRPCMCN